ncbi:prepilin peptidase [Nitrolancea hollandica]|uniref:Peptidase A24A prepilin type IV n=1 Tax=Nitrolancea hollandica Lb TaxID=1129897 RepID=I4EKQ2_9BACT|nr:A24 family peptidase [Nitrolancea hollandica]CCF85264.1 Peptidase A24A prepilin type IV [Nitrolancea hollandica Lb]
MDVLEIIGIVALGGFTGSLAGTAIHALADRLPAGLTPAGPIICTGCRSRFPIDRFIPGRRGICGSCGQELSWYKPVTELAAAGITIVAFLLHGLSGAGLVAGIFSLILLLILRVDWQYHLISGITILPGLALALGAAAFRSEQELLSAATAAVGAGVVFLAFYAVGILLYRQPALGFGDVLLAMLIGAMTGTRQVVLALFIGMVVAVTAGGIIAVMIDHQNRRGFIPFGAYLCAAAILVLLLG